MSIGDRFKYNSSIKRHDIWEIIKIDDHPLPVMRCIESCNSRYYVGDVRRWNTRVSGTMGWEYLGNFAKTNNFNEIYNKLNEKG